MSKKINCKEAILDAAEKVVLEAGAAHMSLDHVAQKADVSKGGLMYHFPNKECLLRAMLSRLISQIYADREQRLKKLTERPNRIIKAGILTTLNRNEKRNRTGQALLAVMSHDPDLVAPMRKAYQDHLEELKTSGVKFEKTAILSLAADGLLFLELLRVSPFNDSQRTKIENEIVRQIDNEIENNE
ncbi:MAG: TetR family transcriptional regulator [Candidatus Omnitrophica bacterium]|nr:TetR family transcriptional regulator [Candidatus Omnitrophota bacterium]